MTADPYLASGGAGSPGSWNRFAYVEGDPVNWMDRRGLDKCGSNPNCVEVFAPFDGVPYDHIFGMGGRALGDDGSIIYPSTPREKGEAIEQVKREQLEDRWGEEAEEALTTAGGCLRDAVFDHFGFNIAAGVVTALGAQIYKGWVPPFRVIGNPSTTLLSVVGHYVQVTIPRVLNSANLLRAAGRIAGPVGATLLAYDTVAILRGTWYCYQKKSQDSSEP